MWQVSAWQTKLLQHIARSTQTQCKLAYKDCIAARTDEFIADASESNSAPARNLAKRLKLARTRPRIASAPVLDKQGVPITSSKDLDLLWSQQFAEEISNQVLPLTAEQFRLCIADRRQATQAVDNPSGVPHIVQSDLPATVDQWMDFLLSRLPKVRKGKAVGRGGIPNGLYQAAGERGQRLLAQLFCRVRWEGPPMSWRGGQMWAGPRKPQLPLSPNNSRALLCADHKANHYSAALRAALAPVLRDTVQGQQSGVVKGGGTEFPMFTARLFLRHAALREVSAAVLFGDLQMAYYSVLVELVTGPLLTPEERRVVLENTSMDELRRLTLEVDLSQGHCLFDHLPLPQDLKAAVREWLRLAWFTVEGSPFSLYTT